MKAVSLCANRLPNCSPQIHLPFGVISRGTVPTTIDLGQEGSLIPFNALNQAWAPTLLSSLKPRCAQALKDFINDSERAEGK